MYLDCERIFKKVWDIQLGITFHVIFLGAVVYLLDIGLICYLFIYSFIYEISQK